MTVAIKEIGRQIAVSQTACNIAEMGFRAVVLRQNAKFLSGNQVVLDGPGHGSAPALLLRAHLA